MADALTWQDAALLDGAPSEAQPETRATTLVVENMVCGGCMGKVERALAAVDGVSDVRANLSLKRAAVTFAPAVVSTQTLVDTLQAAGFKAAELVGDVAPETRDAEKALLRRVAIAGFAAANIMLLSVSVWSGGDGDMSPTV